MRLILWISIFCSSMAFAANEAGGGTHPCKEDFMDIVGWMSGQTLGKLNHLTPQDVSILAAAFKVVMPNENPGFTIAVKEKPIKNCPNTDNPYACGRPDQNLLELYCSKSGEGWMSLEQERKVRNVIHELMWWSTDYNDANFYYSMGIARRLLSATPLISESAADAACVQSLEALRQNLPLLHSLLVQNENVPYAQQDLYDSINKNADTCISTCEPASRKTCEEIKQTATLVRSR